MCVVWSGWHLTRGSGLWEVSRHRKIVTKNQDIAMIRHIVFFTARNVSDRESVYDGLKILTEIPDCLRLEIGRNFQNDRISPGGPDFVVYGEFKDEAQLAAYKAHPLYAKSIELVRPLRDMRIAADFLSEANLPA